MPGAIRFLILFRLSDSFISCTRLPPYPVVGAWSVGVPSQVAFVVGVGLGAGVKVATVFALFTGRSFPEQSHAWIGFRMDRVLEPLSLLLVQW